MRVLVTGSAGFIGSALTIKLIEEGKTVIGIDNINNYYDPDLKIKRLERYIDHPSYYHNFTDIEDANEVNQIFKKYKPDIVVNLAAQAGVRYSIENPLAYVNTNLVGFANILEGCRMAKVKHLVYASSSSVYGSNLSMPFSTNDSVNHPLSLYAASKKANELMAHTYSHLYNLPTTGLRFFTVYGPWGRPDMALFKFTKSIIEGKPIDVFNFGKHKRDFTYINDIVEGVFRILENPAKANDSWTGNDPDPSSSSSPWKIYNIGNNSPVELMDYISSIEKHLGLKAKLNLLPLQDGDVPDTYADVSSLIKDFDYKPSTSVDKGVGNFIKWYKDFYKL